MSRAGDVLRLAKKRIRKRSQWAKGHFVTIGGEWRGWSAMDNPAACLCADGALLFVCKGKPMPVGASLSLSLAARARGFETASRFNDAPETTHGDVMALFDEAAALADASPE